MDGIQPNSSINTATPLWVEACRKDNSSENKKVRKDNDIQVSISVPRKANIIFVLFIQISLESSTFGFRDVKSFTIVRT